MAEGSGWRTVGRRQGSEADRFQNALGEFDADRYIVYPEDGWCFH